MNGLSKPIVEEDGLVFVEAPAAYAAVRVSKGGAQLEERVFQGKKVEGNVYQTPPAYILTPADEYAPVVLEVMAKSDVTSLDAFKAKVRACEVGFDGPILEYSTIYGVHLTFDTSFKKTPSINGKPVNYAPKKVFESPFLNADYNSGVVTISKGKRKKVLEF
jgi:hypothetical protein